MYLPEPAEFAEKDKNHDFFQKTFSASSVCSSERSERVMDLKTGLLF